MTTLNYKILSTQKTLATDTSKANGFYATETPHPQLISNGDTFTVFTKITKEELIKFTQWLANKTTKTPPDPSSKEDHILQWIKTNIYPTVQLNPMTRQLTIGQGDQKIILIGQNQKTGEFVAIGKDTDTYRNQKNIYPQIEETQDHVTEQLKAPEAHDLLNILGHAKDTTDQNRTYTVTPLYGLTLEDYTKKNNLSENERLTLGIKVCEMIQKNHDLGIFLADLKTANFLLPLDSNPNEVTFVDYGLSLTMVDTQKYLTELTGNEPNGWPTLHLIETVSDQYVPSMAQFADTFSAAVMIFDLISENKYRFARINIIQPAAETIHAIKTNKTNDPDQTLKLHCLNLWQNAHKTSLSSYQENLQKEQPHTYTKYAGLLCFLQMIFNSQQHINLKDLSKALETVQQQLHPTP